LFIEKVKHRTLTNHHIYHERTNHIDVKPTLHKRHIWVWVVRIVKVALRRILHMYLKPLPRLRFKHWLKLINFSIKDEWCCYETLPWFRVKVGKCDVWLLIMIVLWRTQRLLIRVYRLIIYCFLTLDRLPCVSFRQWVC